MTKRAASRARRGTRHGAAEKLLSQALKRESRIVSEELEYAKLARMQDSQLDGVLQKQRRGGRATGAKHANRGAAAGAASSGDIRRTLSEMDEAKERISGLLRGSRDAALAR